MHAARIDRYDHHNTMITILLIITTVIKRWICFFNIITIVMVTIVILSVVVVSVIIHRGLWPRGVQINDSTASTTSTQFYQTLPLPPPWHELTQLEQTWSQSPPPGVPWKPNKNLVKTTKIASKPFHNPSEWSQGTCGTFLDPGLPWKRWKLQKINKKKYICFKSSFQ